jgi:hypothetical protein
MNQANRSRTSPLKELEIPAQSEGGTYQRRKMRKKHAFNIVSLFCLALLLAGFAPRAVADVDDPPSRVARLAYAQGSVSFQPAGTDDWVVPGLNRPVTTGDQLWADRDGRVELQLDGSLIRLSSNTGFSFLNLSDSVTQIQLTAGTILVRVRRVDNDETYEVDTPNLAFSIQRPGLYRISVNEAGDSTAIKIRSGEGEVTGEGAAYSLGSNDSYTFSGTDQLHADSDNYGGDGDQFDSWAADRDRRWERSESARYVSADVVGYEDLDDHGEWRQAGEYGNVWFPRTSEPDWAPYHYGHWAYIEPWGYTWVDDEPWGFAPFHYGRWVSYGGRWGWVPAPPRVEGVVYVRPVYAPALVAWVGGPHFAIGVGVGAGGYASGVNVGWFPLGPREVYVPSYRVSRNYVNNVNVSNTTVTTVVVNNYYNTTVVNNNVNVTNVKYVNQGVRGAVTATTPQAFTSAQPVARNVVRVDQREVASAPVRPFTPAAVPVKQAVLGTGAASAKPPATFVKRAVVAKVAPPPPPPPFEKRQEAIKNNGGKPLSVAQVRQIEPAAARREAPVKIAPAVKPVAPQAQANRPGQPQNRPPAQAAPNPPAQANRPADRPANPNSAPEAAPANRPAPGQAARSNETPTPPQAAAPAKNAEADRKLQQEQEQARAKQAQEQQQLQKQQDAQKQQEAAQRQQEAQRQQQLQKQQDAQKQQEAAQRQQEAQKQQQLQKQQDAQKQQEAAQRQQEAQRQQQLQKQQDAQKQQEAAQRQQEAQKQQQLQKQQEAQRQQEQERQREQKQQEQQRAKAAPPAQQPQDKQKAEDKKKEKPKDERNPDSKP